MAEGAIEGPAKLYKVAGPYETRFAFSRFDAAEIASPPAELSAGDAAAIE